MTCGNFLHFIDIYGQAIPRVKIIIHVNIIAIMLDMCHIIKKIE